MGFRLAKPTPGIVLVDVEEEVNRFGEPFGHDFICNFAGGRIFFLPFVLHGSVVYLRKLEERGLVVSQFSPATKTERWFFPLRNGVMSGMSLATVVMEAGETSGALKQADYALAQGRLLIIPEPMTRNANVRWPGEYVKRGAKVAKDPTEVLRCLREPCIREAPRYGKPGQHGGIYEHGGNC